jgi:hypothetical protein
MRNFYIVHDYTDMRQGIVPLADTDFVKVAPVAGTVPDCAYDDTSCNGFSPLLSEEIVYLLQITAAILFFIVLPGVGYYFVYMKSETTTMPELPEDFVPEDVTSDFDYSRQIVYD